MADERLYRKNPEIKPIVVRLGKLCLEKEPKENRGTKGRPKKLNIEECRLFLSACQYFGLSAKKAFELTNKIWKKLGNEGEYVSYDTFETRYDEIRKDAELRKKFEEFYNKYQEERKNKKKEYNVFDVDAFEAFVRAYKENPNMSEQEIKNYLKKISDFVTIQRFVYRFVVNQEISARYFKNAIAVARDSYNLLKDKQPDPRKWGEEEYRELERYWRNRRKKSFYQPMTLIDDTLPVTENFTVHIKGYQRGKKRIGVRNGIKFTLLPEEFLRLNEWCKKENVSDYMCERFRDAIMLHITTMAREGESTEEDSSLLGIKWTDIDWVNCTVTVYESKTEKTWEGIDLNLFEKTFCEKLKKYKEYAEKNFKSEDRRKYVFLSIIPWETYKDYLYRFGQFLGKHPGDEEAEPAFIPHDIRRSGAYWRVNYLNLPLEVITGFPKLKRVRSPFGVGWEDPLTMVNYYASPQSIIEKVYQRIKNLSTQILENPQEVKKKSLEVM
jgi:integrase